MADAGVVCKQLGCGAAVSAPGNAHIGRGSGPIWLKNIACDGTKSALWHCGNEGWGKNDCGNGEEAGVTCSALKLVQEDNSPIANETVQLKLNGKNVGNYTTAENGTVQLSINMSELFNPDFNLRLLNKEGFVLLVTVSKELAPVARMLFYTVHSAGELVVDSIRFQIEKCFRNKLHLQFSGKLGLAVSNISIHLNATANSHCALQAMAQSVSLLRPERELSAETVYKLFPLKESHGYHFNGLNLEDDSKEPCVVADKIFSQQLVLCACKL
ncbi:unnamed protein product [Eretmochelys imbricata]